MHDIIMQIYKTKPPIKDLKPLHVFNITPFKAKSKLTFFKIQNADLFYFTLNDFVIDMYVKQITKD